MESQQIGRALILAAALLGGVVQAQTPPLHPGVKGGSDEQGEYISYKGWWKPAPDHTPNCNTTIGPGGTSGVAQPGGRGGGRGGQANAGPCWVWGDVSGVAADTPNRLIVAVWGDRDLRTGAQRPGGSNYVIEVDGNGNLIKRWSQWDNLFSQTHQVYISPYDPERNIYIIDLGGTQPGVNGEPDRQVHEAVYKFSNDGSKKIWGLVDPAPKLSPREQRALPEASLRPTDFGQPSVLVFLPDGKHFLLADGYDNGRIQTWTTDGQFVSEFGKIDRDPAVGGPPGAFDLIHGIAVDRAGRIYVGDRRNNRIQVFTPEGKFIEEWDGIIDPVGIFIDTNESVWVISATLNRVMKYNTKGELLYHFGTNGRTASGFPGGFARPHQIDVDSAGNVYLTSWDWPGYVTKLTPRPGADPAKLVGQKLGTKPSK